MQIAKKIPHTGIFYIEYMIHSILPRGHVVQSARLKMRRTMASHLPRRPRQARFPHAALCSNRETGLPWGRGGLLVYAEPAQKLHICRGVKTDTLCPVQPWTRTERPI